MGGGGETWGFPGSHPGLPCHLPSCEADATFPPSKLAPSSVTFLVLHLLACANPTHPHSPYTTTTSSRKPSLPHAMAISLPLPHLSHTCSAACVFSPLQQCSVHKSMHWIM